MRTHLKRQEIVAAVSEMFQKAIAANFIVWPEHWTNWKTERLHLRPSVWVAVRACVLVFACVCMCVNEREWKGKSLCSISSTVIIFHLTTQLSFLQVTFAEQLLVRKSCLSVSFSNFLAHCTQTVMQCSIRRTVLPSQMILVVLFRRDYLPQKLPIK